MNDIRKYIILVESQEIDEAGGIIDRLMSKLPGKRGARAGGRVDKKEMFKMLRKTWVQHAASTGDDEEDPEAIKEFLRWASLSDQQIDQISALNKINVNINDVFKVAAEFVNQNAGPDASGAKSFKIGRDKKSPKSPKSPKVSSTTGSSFEDIEKTFKKLGGNSKNLIREIRDVKNVRRLQDTPLAMLGYIYIQEVRDKK